jgi:hypothetical protein
VLGLMGRLSDAGTRKSGPVETWGDHALWSAEEGFVQAEKERLAQAPDWLLDQNAHAHITSLDPRVAMHGKPESCQSAVQSDR